MQNEKWLDWAIKIQALAQAGLFYSKDKYNIERFEELRDIAAEMVAYKTEIPKEKVKDLFCSDEGYQTPKLETRAAIFQGEKILLIQEDNGTWCLPGGWCDVDVSAKENLIKETKEEAGLDVEVERVVAILDHNKHNYPSYAYNICKIFAICKNLGGSFVENIETIDSGFFSLEELPKNIASEKVNLDQIKMCFDAYKDENWKVIID